MLNCFCDHCSKRLNDFWEAYQENEIDLIQCENCQEWTFKDLSYCINCGKKVIIKVLDQPVNEVGFEEAQTDEERKTKKLRYAIFGILGIVIGIIITIGIIVYAIMSLRFGFYCCLEGCVECLEVWDNCWESHQDQSCNNALSKTGNYRNDYGNFGLREFLKSNLKLIGG